MAGIFGGYNLEDYQFSKEKNLEYIGKNYDDFSYGRKYIDKFENERFILETDTYICVFEGFLFDIKGYQTQKEFFSEVLLLRDIKTFLNDLDGIFSFSLYLKEEKKIILATDHLASMKVFYSNKGEKFIFSNDMFDISDFYKKSDVTLELDLDATYFFLSFGSVVSERTLFLDIKKLEPSTYLEYDVATGLSFVSKYSTLVFGEENKLNEEEIIDKYEVLISKAMDRIIRLNTTYNLEHIAGLSGGLDSKSMAIALQQRSQDKLTTFTFAEYNSLDQKIAQEVASKLGFIHNFMALDNGNCLLHNFEEVVKVSNGMVALHTVLHSYNSFRNINTNPFGLMLTGQIGDAIFGSHFIGNSTIREYITSKSHYGSSPEFLLNKIGFMDELLASYNHGNSEAYIYEGRIANGTMYGDIILRNRIDTLTPFYSKALLNFTLTVPDKYRVGEDIYIKWLKKYHPSVVKFRWDKCDCLPTSKERIKFFKLFYTLKNALKKRLKLKYDGMNPFDVWYRENPKILENLDNIYNENIKILDFNSELKSDVVRLFTSNIDRYQRNKFVVVTLLLSLKLHLYGKEDE